MLNHSALQLWEGHRVALQQKGTMDGGVLFCNGFIRSPQGEKGSKGIIAFAST